MDRSDVPPVIFFDGVCGLCNGFVDFVIRHDSEAVFRFSSFPNDAKDLKTVLLKEGDRVFEKSTAVLRIFYLMGGLWRCISYLRIVPIPLRDWAYDLVARHRYRVFGKLDSCRLPSPEERKRFL